MKKSSMGIICIVIVLIIVGIAMVSSYNGMVSKQEAVESSLSDLDVMLQRRADLIPNLVSTVKGYTSHETEIIDKITEARSNLVNAKSVEEKSKANSELSKSLDGLMVIMSNNL